jgi:hypothetical protein
VARRTNAKQSASDGSPSAWYLRAVGTPRALAGALLVQTHDPVSEFAPVVALDQQELLPGHSLR